RVQLQEARAALRSPAWSKRRPGRVELDHRSGRPGGRIERELEHVIESARRLRVDDQISEAVGVETVVRPRARLDRSAARSECDVDLPARGDFPQSCVTLLIP